MVYNFIDITSFQDEATEFDRLSKDPLHNAAHNHTNNTSLSVAKVKVFCHCIQKRAHAL